MEVLVDEGGLLDELLLRIARCELGLQGVEGILALVLHRAAGGDGVGLVVELADDGLAQLLVVDLVAVGALDILAQLLRELNLYGAVLLDFLVRELDGAEHHLLGDLLHLTLDHEDVVNRTADHDVEVGLGHLREGGVDDVLAADAGHAHLRDGAAEGDVRYGEGGRSGQTRQCVGLNILVCRDEVDRHVYLGVEIRGEERAQGAVNQTCNENLAVVGLAFALHEASGVAARGGIFLLVLHLKRHEVGVGFCILGGNDRGQEHRVSLLHHDGAVGLFGQFARFNLNLATVGQRDDFADCVVQLLFFHKNILNVFELS